MQEGMRLSRRLRVSCSSKVAPAAAVAVEAAAGAACWPAVAGVVLAMYRLPSGRLYGLIELWQDCESGVGSRSCAPALSWILPDGT
jgi:hypothetical protein